MLKKLFFLLISLQCFGQLSIDSISYDYFYKKELKEVVKLKKEIEQAKFKTKKQLALAELYKNINCEDSAYATLFNVFKKEKIKKTLSIEAYNDLLYELYLTGSNKNNYEKNNTYFLDQIQKKNNPEKWNALYYKELALNYFLDSANIEKTNFYYDKIVNTSYFKNNTEFQSIIYLNMGNFKTGINDFKMAETFLQKGLSIAKNNNDLLREIYFNINLAANHNKQRNYKSALINLETAENIPFKKFKPKMYKFIYNLKGDAYYGLNDSLQVTYCDNVVKKLDQLINDFAKNSNFYEIDAKLLVDETQKENAILKKAIQSYQNNKMTYFCISIFAFLLGLYSFIRWKKVDHNRKKLAKEKESLEVSHFQTIEELEKTKQLVIEDHIVLKNKAKIYLDELIYIKSEDHYLELFTTSKKEFVRGKINDIIEQLPPNFKQCHRSFVVNINFIHSILKNSILLNDKTEIPLARNKKKDFE